MKRPDCFDSHASDLHAFQRRRFTLGWAVLTVALLIATIAVGQFRGLGAAVHLAQLVFLLADGLIEPRFFMVSGASSILTLCRSITSSCSQR